MNPNGETAYILKTVDYGEHGKILYAYTANGIKNAIARGVKKMQSPLRHLVQAGMFINMELSKSKFPTLKDAQMNTYHQNIRDDIVKTTVAATIRELIYFNVNEHDDHPKLFAFLEKVLTVLDKTDAPLEVLMIFELKFLYFLGYGISFNKCSQCNANKNLQLDIYTGMMFCKTHIDEHTALIPESEYAPLKYYLHVDIVKFKPLNHKKTTLNTLTNIIDGLYESHLSAKTKAKKLLKTLY